MRKCSNRVRKGEIGGWRAGASWAEERTPEHRRPGNVPRVRTRTKTTPYQGLLEDLGSPLNPPVGAIIIRQEEIEYLAFPSKEPPQRGSGEKLELFTREVNG